MPIYEFKCLKCEEFFELLVMGGDKEEEVACPKCKEQSFERVMSTTNFSMGTGAGGPSSARPDNSPDCNPAGCNVTGGCGSSSGAHTENRQCSAGSCTTYNLPGPTG